MIDDKPSHSAHDPKKPKAEETQDANEQMDAAFEEDTDQPAEKLPLRPGGLHGGSD